MRKGWRERVGGGGLEEEAREKAHAGGLRVWDVGEGGCAGGVVGWGRAEYRKEAEGAARDIDEDDSDTDIKKKRKRRERREGATAG